jgi:selenocysteine lyase/cysteine desulfurase
MTDEQRAKATAATTAIAEADAMIAACRMWNISGQTVEAIAKCNMALFEAGTKRLQAEQTLKAIQVEILSKGSP